LDLLPECVLRNDVITAAVASLADLGEGFRQALPKAFDEALPKAKANQNQDQDQKQKREGEGLASAEAFPEPSPDHPPPQQDDCEALRVAWNAITTPPIPRCQKLTASRRAKIRARLKERSLDDWRDVFRRVEASRFLHGESEKGWRIDLDWLLKNQDHVEHVLDGRYDDRPASATPKATSLGGVNGSGPNYPTAEETRALLSVGRPGGEA
jgi:hypothetical protein